MFKTLESLGGIERQDMYNIFNMGIGMVAAVDPATAQDVLRLFNENGEKAAVIGTISGTEGIRMKIAGGFV